MSLVCEENLGSGTFTESTQVRPSRMSSPVVSTLAFLASSFLLDVLVERARHRRAQAGQVRAAVALRDVVGEALHVLAVGVVPLHRHFDRDAVLLADRVEDVRVQHRLAAVHVLDEALARRRRTRSSRSCRALVDQLDLDAVVQERQLAQALARGCRSGTRRCRRSRVEARKCTSVPRRSVVPVDAQRRHRDAVAELHLVHLAVAPDASAQPLRQRVHDRHAHAVQAAGDLVASSGRTCRRRAARSSRSRRPSASARRRP